MNTTFGAAYQRFTNVCIRRQKIAESLAFCTDCARFLRPRACVLASKSDQYLNLPRLSSAMDESNRQLADLNTCLRSSVDWPT